jgi:hypothetical protein
MKELKFWCNTNTNMFLPMVAFKKYENLGYKINYDKIIVWDLHTDVIMTGKEYEKKIS